MAHLLQQAVINRYGAADWTCTDLPRVEGETPVGGVYIKQRCTKDTAARQLALETHFLRKPGQQAVNPATREYTQASSKAGRDSSCSTPPTPSRDIALSARGCRPA